MSWFDGIIPESCRDCYRFVKGKWQYREDAECDDSCDFFLAMFPLIKENGKIDEEKMDLLFTATEEPEWHI